MDESSDEFPFADFEDDRPTPPQEHVTFSAGTARSKRNGLKYRLLRAENLRRFKVWMNRYSPPEPC